MKKVIEIRNRIDGEKLPLEKIEILAVGSNWVTAKFKGYGFIKTYGPCDGYEVKFENN